MSDAGMLVVGGGQAGYQVAASLRDAGYAGRVVLASEEPDLPYQRPPLTKAYLDGSCESDQLPFQGEAYYQRRGIEVLLGTKVVSIDRAARRVATADGRRLDYGHLVLATGARNRLLPGWDEGAAGLVTVRTVRDAAALRADLNSVKRALVVGAGFLGLEFAAAAVSKGVAVRVIEATPHVMSRAVSADIADSFKRHHETRGVEFNMNTCITRIDVEGGRLIGAQTSGGDIHPADLLVLCIGVVPNTELARDAGLAVGNGVVVDSDLLTDDPAISAIGDCAAFPSRFADGICRLESVQNAVDQARHVALRLAGGPRQPYSPVPWFWSDQGGMKLQIAGLLMGRADRIVVRGDQPGLKFSTYGFQNDRLIAVESVNRPADHMAARRLLAADVCVTPRQAADLQFDLKTLLPAKAHLPAETQVPATTPLQ